MKTDRFSTAEQWGEYFSQTVLTYPEQIRVKVFQIRMLGGYLLFIHF